MSSEPTVEQRTLLQLRTGTKISLLVAVLLLVAAVYFYILPVQLVTSQGAAFGCGSAMSPPSEKFQQSICLDSTTINAYRAYCLAAAAALMAGLGWYFFGADKKVETRYVPRPATFEEN